MTQKELPPEVKEKLLEGLKIGVEKGYGYHRIWKMLKTNGIDIKRSTVREYYYKLYPDRVERRGPYLDRATRIKLLEEVKELRKQGQSYGKIIERIEGIYGVRLSWSEISYWIRGIHSPLRGCRIPSIDFLEPSPELAYIIGVVMGDGSVDVRHVGLELSVKDHEFAEEFARCIGLVLKRDPPKPVLRRDGRYLVTASSKVLHDLLQKPVYTERVRRHVEHCRDCTTSFLRGFFDSEGSVNKRGYIRCYNTDERLLEYVKHLLATLGIKATGPHLCKKKGRRFFDGRRGKWYEWKRDEYRLYVAADSLPKFYGLIGLTIERKRRRLEGYLIGRGLLKTPTQQPSPSLLS